MFLFCFVFLLQYKDLALTLSFEYNFPFHFYQCSILNIIIPIMDSFHIRGVFRKILKSISMLFKRLSCKRITLKFILGLIFKIKMGFIEKEKTSLNWIQWCLLVTPSLMQGKNQRAASANIAFAAYQDQISEKKIVISYSLSYSFGHEQLFNSISWPF